MEKYFKKLRPFLIFAVFFIFSLGVIVDTDFGWHLRAGEYIFENRQVPKHDLFSFSLPNYPYVYHSWAGEVLVFLFWRFGGLAGAHVFFAAVLALSFVFIYKTSLIYSKNFNLLLFIPSVIFAQNAVGGKMRVFGFLFLALSYFLFSHFKKFKSKTIWFMPLVFLLWANFHGSFVFGLGIYFLWLGLAVFLKELRTIEIKKLSVIGFLSILAGLINPYFAKAYWQSAQIFWNSVFRLRGINPDWAWLSEMGFFGFFLVLIFLVFLAVLFLRFGKKKFEIILSLTFLILSIFVVRVIFVFIVFFIPLLNNWIFEFKQKKKRQVLNSVLFKFISLNLLAVFVLFAWASVLEVNFASGTNANFSNFINSKLEKKIGYPVWPFEAGEFLIKNGYEDKKVLAEANSANYLILQSRDFKVFYYGPMDNYIVERKPFVFEYLKLVNDESERQELLDKWEIEAAVIQKEFSAANYLLGRSDWEKVFEDDEAYVFVKKSTP